MAGESASVSPALGRRSDSAVQDTGSQPTTSLMCAGPSFQCNTWRSAPPCPELCDRGWLDSMVSDSAIELSRERCKERERGKHDLGGSGMVVLDMGRGQDVMEINQVDEIVEPLDSLPVELLCLILVHLMQPNMVDVVRVGTVSRKWNAAFKQLLNSFPESARNVTCNQRLFEEIHGALEQERLARRRPISRLTQKWIGPSGSPLFSRVLCEWPEAFPYFPPVLCIVFATFLLAYSPPKLAGSPSLAARVIVLEGMVYGGLMGCTALFVLSYLCIGYEAFLTGLSLLFSLFCVVHGALAFSAFAMFFVSGYEIMFMWIALAFVLSGWTIHRHLQMDFQAGYWKTNAIGGLVFSSFSLIYFLLYGG